MYPIIWSVLRKCQWFSGKIQRCHRWAPSSILGWRITFSFDLFDHPFVALVFFAWNLEEARVTLPPVEATELPSIHFERYPSVL